MRSCISQSMFNFSFVTLFTNSRKPWCCKAADAFCCIFSQNTYNPLGLFHLHLTTHPTRVHVFPKAAVGLLPDGLGQFHIQFLRDSETTELDQKSAREHLPQIDTFLPLSGRRQFIIDFVQESKEISISIDVHSVTGHHTNRGQENRSE